MKNLLIVLTVTLLLASCSKSVRREETVAARNETAVEHQRVTAESEVTERTERVTETVSRETDLSRLQEQVDIPVDPASNIADPYIENGVNWSTRTITATGIGAPNPNAPNMAVKRAGAINAARLYALRDLLATLKGMYLSSETTVENYMTTSDVVTTQVEGIAKAFRVVGEPKYFEDGSVEVTVEMSMNGDLSDLLMQDNKFKESGMVDEAKYRLSDLTAKPDVYTGLIIDCSNVQLRPALAPRILSRSGEEIYGSANVSRDFAVQQGMMGYLKAVETARTNARVTNNPMVVTAVGVQGSNKADIVISDEDAARIKQLDSKHDFLRECRVVAIIK